MVLLLLSTASGPAPFLGAADVAASPRCSSARPLGCSREAWAPAPAGGAVVPAAIGIAEHELALPQPGPPLRRLTFSSLGRRRGWAA